MKRVKFDKNQPGVSDMVARIVHGAFVTEGTMVAFPLCFPSVSVAVPADESRITSVAVTEDGTVYAGTSGRAAHLLVGMFHGVTGMVFDMGVPEGADRTAAVCCGKASILAAVNGPEGGRLVRRALQPPPFDLIQEWHIARLPYTYLEVPGDPGPILHAVVTDDRSSMVGITERTLFRCPIEEGAAKRIDGVDGRGRLAVTADGSVVGLDEEKTLWRFDPANGTLERRAIALPDGFAETDAPRWAKSRTSGSLYLADGAGALYVLDRRGNWTGRLGRVPHPPVTTMAVTGDGRLFGSAGDGISRLFCYDPAAGEVRDLGVAVSVFERRRYGYSFGDAVTGRDGEIIFGEDDDLGHIWLYFPRIVARGEE